MSDLVGTPEDRFSHVMAHMVSPMNGGLHGAVVKMRLETTASSPYDHQQKGSGTPRPKTISARDSSDQIDFFTGTPRPGTPRPSYKNTLFVAYNGKQMDI